jgi:hypothetical protein
VSLADAQLPDYHDDEYAYASMDPFDRAINYKLKQVMRERPVQEGETKRCPNLQGRHPLAVSWGHLYEGCLRVACAVYKLVDSSQAADMQTAVMHVGAGVKHHYIKSIAQLTATSVKLANSGSSSSSHSQY